VPVSMSPSTRSSQPSQRSIAAVPDRPNALHIHWSPRGGAGGTCYGSGLHAQGRSAKFTLSLLDHRVFSADRPPRYPVVRVSDWRFRSLQPNQVLRILVATPSGRLFSARVALSGATGHRATARSGAVTWPTDFFPASPPWGRPFAWETGRYAVVYETPDGTELICIGFLGNRGQHPNVW
jgi:hypothetical protein